MDPILLVDDERDNLDAIKRILRNEYAVSTTDSPIEALKLISKNEYFVIISDQRMPEITGVELLEKATSLQPDAVRILLTGYTDIDSVIGAINRGNIYRYVAKPWDVEDLRMTLRQACEAYRLRKELAEKNAALGASNEELRQALADLQLLDKAKRRFLGLISHELNTPITVLDAFMGLVAEFEKDLAPDIQKSLSSMRLASERLSEIVSEVLLYTRLEAETGWEKEAFNWEKEVVGIAHLLEPQRSAKGVSLKVKTKGQASAPCNAQHMKTAVTKLLSDFIQRAPSGSEVQVVVGEDSEGFLLRAHRGGEVISEQALRPFELEDNALRHGRSMGLALAICHFIVGRHGGAMELQSSDAMGTSVQIRLPAS